MPGLDGHLAEREDLAVELGLRDDEAIAGGGVPPQAGVAQRDREVLRDHASSVHGDQLTCGVTRPTPDGAPARRTFGPWRGAREGPP